MVPDLLSEFTSPIVDKALETGARGSTTTVTDYGGISDAFFKKAQLDLDMASLQANTTMRGAELLSGLEMQKADLELRKGQMQMNAAEMADANNAGGMEQLLGAVSGGVSGAVAGFAVGGPTGAMAGGALGAGTTFLGYQSGGKRGGQQAQQTLGVIAGGAQLLKGMNDTRKAEDSWDTMMKTGQNLVSAMNDPSLDVASRQEAMGNWQTHLQDIYSFQVSEMKMNPMQAAQGIQGYSKVMTGGSMSDDPKEAGQYEMTRNALDFQSKMQSAKPEEHRKLVHDFRAKQAISYAKMTGGDEMPESLFDAYVDQSPTTPSLGRGGQDVATLRNEDPNVPTTYEGSSGGSVTTIKPKVSNSQKASMTRDTTTMQDYTNKLSRSPNIPNQGDQSVRTGVPEIGARGQWRPPLARGGVQMDDGMDIFTRPVEAEKELAGMGANAVEALSKPEEMGIVDKVKHNMGLSNDKFDDEKIPLTETRMKESDAVKDWRKGDDEEVSAEAKVGAKLAQRNKEVSSELSTILEVKGGQGAEINNNIDKQLAYIEEGKLKTFNSKGGNFGRGVSRDGIKLKVPFGGPEFGSIGKDAQWTNDPEEASYWSEVDQMTEINASTMARLSGEKGALSESDIERWKKLAPSPGKTREQNIQGLIAQKELLLNKLKTAPVEKAAASKGPARGSQAWMEQEAKIHEFKQSLKEGQRTNWWKEY